MAESIGPLLQFLGGGEMCDAIAHHAIWQVGQDFLSETRRDLADRIAIVLP